MLIALIIEILLNFFSMQFQFDVFDLMSLFKTIRILIVSNVVEKFQLFLFVKLYGLFAIRT